MNFIKFFIFPGLCNAVFFMGCKKAFPQPLGGKLSGQIAAKLCEEGLVGIGDAYSYIPYRQ
jgi:hypothetical protein